MSTDFWHRTRNHASGRPDCIPRCTAFPTSPSSAGANALFLVHSEPYRVPSPPGQVKHLSSSLVNDQWDSVLSFCRNWLHVLLAGYCPTQPPWLPSCQLQCARATTSAVTHIRNVGCCATVPIQLLSRSRATCNCTACMRALRGQSTGFCSFALPLASHALLLSRLRCAHILTQCTRCCLV